MSLTATTEVLLPGDPGYDDARRVFNGAIDRRPSLIVRARDVRDVVFGVRHAREHNLEIAVRGGGHSVAGHSVTESGVMIDLSPMKRVDVDPATRTARVEPGVLLGELDAATQEHGLAVPAGTVSNTGVAGLTLGGGIGWLMRKHGLTIDNLLAVELVTADGELVRASADEEPELFWGIRGAGANFGVVTSFEFRLQRVGPLVAAGPRLYPLEDAADVLRRLRALQESLHAELGLSAVLLTVPPAPHFPPELHGRRMLAIAPCWAGELDDATYAVRPLDELGKPALDAFGPMPYTALQSMLDDTAPPGLHHHNFAEHLDVLSDDAIEALVGQFAQVTHPMAHVVLTLLGGSVEQVAPDATAFPHRNGAWVAWVIGMWHPHEDSEPHRAWLGSIRDALRLHATGGVYVNALDNDRGDRVRAAYGPNWRRLVELKRAWDPENTFRLNANVNPGSATSRNGA
jgi:FAD/FMN-containing dehydrogenase